MRRIEDPGASMEATPTVVEVVAFANLLEYLAINVSSLLWPSGRSVIPHYASTVSCSCYLPSGVIYVESNHFPDSRTSRRIIGSTTMIDVGSRARTRVTA